MINYLTIFCCQHHATGEDLLSNGIFCNRINIVQPSRNGEIFFADLWGLNDPIPELKTANTNGKLSFSTDLSFQEICSGMLEHSIILVSGHQRTGIAKILCGQYIPKSESDGLYKV